MQLTCNVYARLVEGRTLFVAEVKEGNAVRWTGKPCQLYADAACQAQKAADRIYRQWAQGRGGYRPRRGFA